MEKGGNKKGNRLAGVVLVGVVVLSLGLLLFLYFPYPELVIGEEQPVHFSHRVHVTDKRIDCRYCHSLAGRSLNAGMPEVSKCLGCHEYIIPNHPEIRKLKGFMERGEPVPWVRVFYNPDHVYFPHFRHIRRGIACEECHGDVGKEDRLKTKTFYMGFCLGCHRKPSIHASVECTACHQ